MGKGREKREDALDAVYKYAKSKLNENEELVEFGYATLTGRAGPRRCVVALTNQRIIVIWLRKKYCEIEAMQDIPFNNIATFSYRFGVIAFNVGLYAYRHKPFTPRLYIGLVDNKELGFAFDDQQIAKAILEELDRRIPTFHKNG